MHRIIKSMILDGLYLRPSCCTQSKSPCHLFVLIIDPRAKKHDSNTSRVIAATLTSGVLENPNNSLQARFTSRSQRQARSKEKQRELESLSGTQAKKLREEVRAGKQQARENELEIKRLRQQIQKMTQVTPPSQPTSAAGPSRPIQNQCKDNSFSSFSLS